MILPLAYYGAAVLRKKAAPIEQITEDLRLLAQNMIETMDSSNGIGLAAPQVHASVRMFVLRTYLEEEDGSVRFSDPQVFINPKISILDDRIQEDSEGCLSIPKLHGNVVRPFFIRVEAMDLEGQVFTEEVEGYKARGILHENDHLNGVLYIDRIAPRERKALEPQLRAIKKQVAP